jgi:hypothetical protein
VGLGSAADFFQWALLEGGTGKWAEGVCRGDDAWTARTENNPKKWLKHGKRNK